MYRRKKTVVLHIRSACWLQDLFTVEDLCLVRISEGGLVYSLYPKVFFQNNTFGYTKADDDPAGQIWRVHISSNLVVDVNRIPRRCDMSYEYPSKSQISNYWPIRIMLRGSKMSITCSRVALSVNSEGTDARIVMS